ncbi:MAG: LPS export ABC transporter periplasmic protein LptC [Pseudomonadota bacterium]
MTDLGDPTLTAATGKHGKAAKAPAAATEQPALDLSGGAVGLNAFEAGSEYFTGRPSYLGKGEAPAHKPTSDADGPSVPPPLFGRDELHIAVEIEAEAEAETDMATEAVPQIAASGALGDAPTALETEPLETEPLIDRSPKALRPTPLVDSAERVSANNMSAKSASAESAPSQTARPLSIQAAPGAKSSDWYRQRAADRLNPRRSVVIRMLRVVVPSVAALLLIGTLVWPLINADQNGLRQLGRGESAMLNARFEGYDDADRLVSITADQVTRSTGENNLIDLIQPLADITYDDGTRVAIRANQGRFDEDRQQLLLQGDVNMFQPEGFEFTTSRLQIDTSQRAAWSDQPVTGTGPGGSIAGSAVQILENGRFLVFPGPGRLTLDQVANGMTAGGDQ